MSTELVQLEFKFDPSIFTRLEAENGLYDQIYQVVKRSLKEQRDCHIFKVETEVGRLSVDVELLPAGTLKTEPEPGCVQYRMNERRVYHGVEAK